jgi:hypothetical protein
LTLTIPSTRIFRHMSNVHCRYASINKCQRSMRGHALRPCAMDAANLEVVNKS